MRLDRTERWLTFGLRVKRYNYRTLETVGLWGRGSNLPTYGWALVLAIGALFVAITSLPRRRWSRVQLRFPASVKRL